MRRLREKITKDSCGRRIGEAPLRPEMFGSIRADHNDFNEGCESSDNHRYAVVVQNLAFQCIQSYPFKTKTAHEAKWKLSKILGAIASTESCVQNSMEFGNTCEVLTWYQCTPTVYRFETNGIAERAVRRVKEGTSAVLLQSGLDDWWWSDSTEC